MIRMGCCINMFSDKRDATGIRNSEILSQLQYDFVELSLAQITEVDTPSFDWLIQALHSAGIPCEVCNCFIPASIRLTGEEVSVNSIRVYLQKALERAARLGVRVIVFGSSGARKLDRGFPREHANAQLVEFLQIVSDMALQYRINIAIEGLNKNECNIINTLEDGAALVEAVGQPNIRLLADYYHMEMLGENAEVIPQLHSRGIVFEHMHIADMRTNRGFPLEEEPFIPFANALRSIGYNGRISIEGRTDQFEQDAATARDVLTRLFR